MGFISSRRRVNCKRLMRNNSLKINLYIVATASSKWIGDNDEEAPAEIIQRPQSIIYFSMLVST